uniref:Tr-type G domain-containing protein n=1 Tax=Megaselia scalaris TaxID=36166 RepID=T1GT41_MEGSC
KEPSPSEDLDEDNDEGGTVKTAAQKKKEKKERQKREAALAKQKAKDQPPASKEPTPAPKVEPEPEPEPVEVEDKEKSEEPENDKKNKKKKGKDKKAAAEEKEAEKKDTKKKGMSAAMVAAMQEKLKLIKEEEERLRKEEEEKQRQEEERERQRLEAIRLEKERKEKKKQKEAEKKARLKAEGKLLTKKQKEDRARAQNMLEALKAQGLDIPDPVEKRPRPGTRIRNNKKKVGTQKSEEEVKQDSQEEVSKESTPSVDEKKKEEEIKDSWDAALMKMTILKKSLKKLLPHINPKKFLRFRTQASWSSFIDTPGHESFSNLRNRGSSLCDIAILVVDIMHGLEPQTLESINLLKQKKCPFIVALNKIDRLYDWQTFQRRDIRDVIKNQQANTQLEFQQRTKEVILQFAEQGLNAALFYENPDPRSYVSLVPTSAITGEGMGNLLYLIVESCQSLLPKRLMYSEELQAIVLEVKAIQGLGTTIDAILINGRLREGDTMIVAGTDGPIVTQIRSLLMPQPLKELRVKSAYVEHKEIMAAQGVKIAAKDLEKAIAGINLVVANNPDEVEIGREEVAGELKNALSHIKLKQLGVYVQASTLGSLEALLDFLGASKIPNH